MLMSGMRQEPSDEATALDAGVDLFLTKTDIVKSWDCFLRHIDALVLLNSARPVLLIIPG